MIKSLAITLSCFVVAIQATESTIDYIGGYINYCTSTSGVTDVMVLETRSGIFNDDDVLKEYLFCMGKLSGIINEDGQPNEEVIRIKISIKYGEAAGKHVAMSCGGIKEETPQDTSFAMAKCFHNKSKFINYKP